MVGVEEKVDAGERGHNSLTAWRQVRFLHAIWTKSVRRVAFMSHK